MVAILLLAGALLGGCAAAGPQLRQVEKTPDKPKPADESGIANFEALFEQKVLSRSVYPKPKDPELLRRVLLGPNLVFESSRSSLEEPRTIGPANAATPAPDMQDALGGPIAIELSSALMKYLSDKGSVLLAPAVTRRWSWEWWCTPSWCPKTTWVERLILMGQKPPATGASPSTEFRAEDLPTAALAVRRLGTWSQKMDVVAEAAAERSEIVFRPRRSKDEPSVCPTISLEIPVVAFMAEIVSLKDGRILARIDEQRTPRLTADFKLSISTKSWKPKTDKGYTTYDASTNRPVGGGYVYVSDWTAEDRGCASAQEAYKELVELAYRQRDAQLASTVGEILSVGLDPLY
jgi:hypothetical protein